MLLFLHSIRKKWSVGQGVKTPPFHGGITGSIPVRSTKEKAVSNCSPMLAAFLFVSFFEGKSGTYAVSLAAVAIL